MSGYEYELCIVGAGMIGSAAARHASQLLAGKVCLVGPSEPKERKVEDSRDIFGAYYDEGRITRSCDSDPVWATLAQHSISRYREIEKMSSIHFYTEVGNLTVGDVHQSYIKSARENARKQKVSHKLLSETDLKLFLPYLDFASTDVAVFEEINAGYINPRRLVEAQKLIASRHGCTYLDDVVNYVERIVQTDGSYGMKVTTGQGTVIKCKRVLLATGAFTTFRELLPRFESEQKLCPLTVALVEVSQRDAEKMRYMPCVVYKGKGKDTYYKDFPRTSDGSALYYMLPPIKYPDGKFYVKLGYFHDSLPARLNTAKEVKDWYCQGNPKLAEDTAKFIKTLFKGVTMERYKGDFCVVTETTTNRPYIDTVHAQLGVAIGGNGFAAKSSDEIGRIAVSMMMGVWNSDIPQSTFRLRIRKDGTHFSRL